MKCGKCGVEPSSGQMVHHRDESVECMTCYLGRLDEEFERGMQEHRAKELLDERIGKIPADASDKEFHTIKMRVENWRAIGRRLRYWS